MELKRIPEAAIPVALEKAHRYRLLNEPNEAESICRDVLIVDPDHRGALVTLLLALTDQFETEFTTAFTEAKEVLGRLAAEYDSAYYEGILYERWANAQLAKGLPLEGAIGWYREAMRCYELAETLRKPDDPDSILRWNTCVRVLRRLEQAEVQPAGVTPIDQSDFGGDLPLE